MSPAWSTDENEELGPVLRVYSPAIGRSLTEDCRVLSFTVAAVSLPQAASSMHMRAITGTSIRHVLRVFIF